MADFKDAAVWKKWFFLCIMLGMTHLLFAYAAGLGSNATNSKEAIFVIGYLGMIVATVLALGILLTDELNSNKIALICFVIFAFIGGIATVIGCALWGGDRNSKAGGHYLHTFSTMLGVMSALFGILAGIFGILDLVGVGAG